MASLERRGNRFRVIFRLGGQKHQVSVKATDEKDAEARTVSHHDQVKAILARGGIDKRKERELWDGLFLNPTEIAEVLAHVKRKTSARYLYPLLVTAAHTGARRSELFRARVEDIDFDAKLVLLREKKRNGTVIEQEQILTTHNLAVLFEALGFRDTLRPRLRGLAERCFTWICRSLQQKRDPWKAKLQAVKNGAYAFRQMVFFLALLPREETERFLAWAEEHFGEQRADFRDRFDQALAGLRLAVSGGTTAATGSGPKRFLGWTTGKHWLLE
jgi:integrase